MVRGNVRSQLQGTELNKKGLNVSQILTTIFFRVLFPLVLTIICVFSENYIKCLLLVFLFAHPFVPTPGSPILKRSTKWYLVVLGGYATIKFTLNFSLLITVYVSDDVRAQLSCDSDLGKLLRQFGFDNLHGHDWKNVLRQLGTEGALLLICLNSLMAHHCCRSRPTRTFLSADKERRRKIMEQRQKNDEATRIRIQIIFSPVFEILAILLMIASACCIPSIPSLFYLLWYLTGGALWALHTDVFRWFYKYSWAMLLVCALNIFTLALFQGELMIDLVDADDIWLRLFGINQMVHYDCVSEPGGSGISDETMLPHFNGNLTDAQFLNTFFLVSLYYLLAYNYSFYLNYSKQQKELGNLDYFGKRRHKASNAIRNSAMFKEGTILNWLLIKTKVTRACELAWNQVENNFYLFSVSFMIFWSIFCHGIITLTLLFTAIYLWTRSKSNTRTKKTAPFLVVYCTLYIIVQHIFNFDLKESEFVKHEFVIISGNDPVILTMEEIRLTSASMSMLFYLGSQCLFMISFWILLRYFMTDYRLKRHENPEEQLQEPLDDVMTEEEEQRARQFVKTNNKKKKTLPAIITNLYGNKRRLKEIASALWMTLCIITLMLVSTTERPDWFRIGYMVFFLTFIVYTVIKLSMKSLENQVPNFELFLRFILFYSLLVLLILYIIQFDLNIDQYLRDENLDPNLSLILPMAFLLVVMKVQFDYFHEHFNNFMGHFSASSSIPLEAASLSKAKNPFLKAIQEDPIAKKVSKVTSQVVEFIWLLLRIHIDKIFLLVLMGVVVEATSAIHFLFLLIFIFLCFTKRKFWFFGQLVAYCLSSVTILSRMSYMVYMVEISDQDHDSTLENCTDPSNFPWTQSLPRWIGFYEGEHLDQPSILYLWPQLCLVNIFFLTALIKQRMKSRLDKIDRKRNHCEIHNDQDGFVRYQTKSLNLIFSIRYRILFPSISRADADEGFKNLALYLCNYWFYKFGLEFIIIYVTTIVCDTGDFYSMFYIVLLIPLMVSRREKVSFYARIFFIYTSLVLVIKFMFLLWVPPLDIFCNYEFLDWMKDSKDREQFMATKLFFYLPDFYEPKKYELKTSDLVAELFLLTVLRSFLRNLRMEKDDKKLHQHAGNNFDCLDEPDRINPGKQNLIKFRIIYQQTNFTSEQKHPMNVLKKIIFMHGIWVTYFLLGLRGLKCFDILGFLYICFAVHLLWLGQEIALQTRKHMVKIMNIIIIYVSINMVVRILIQMAGFFCNQPDLQDAWDNIEYLINTFDVKILKRYELYQDSAQTSKHCESMFFNETGILTWEMVCIITVTIQKRIFISHYYDFVMEEIATTMEMSKQGGILIQKFNKLDIAKAIATREKITKDLETAIQRIRQRMLSMDDWYEPVDHLDSIFSGHRFFNQHFDPDKDDQSSDDKTSGDGSSQSSITAEGEEVDDCDMREIWANYRTEIKKLTIERCFPPKPEATTSDKSETETEMTSQTKNDQVKEPNQSTDDLIPSTSRNFSSEDQQSEEVAGKKIDENVPTNSYGTEKLVDGANLDISKLEVGSESDDDEDETGIIAETIGKVDKILAVLKFIFFAVLAHVAEIFDSASKAFRRVIFRLEEMRKRRKTFLQEESSDRNQSRFFTANSVEDTDSQYGSLAILVDSDDASDTNETPRDQKPGPSSSISVKTEGLEQPDNQNADDVKVTRKETLKDRYSVYVLFIRDFWLSFYLFLTSQTDHVSYFLIGFVVTLDGSILEMVLAVTCLVWGLLSKPRPTKLFWSCCTFLTALIIVSKWFFETQLFTFNQQPLSEPPYALEVTVGSLRPQTPLIYAWLLLVFLCFHRNILLSFGLWTNYESNQKEQETYNEQSNNTTLISSVRYHSSNIDDSEVLDIPMTTTSHGSVNDTDISVTNLEDSACYSSTKTLVQILESEETEESSKQSKVTAITATVVDTTNEIKTFYRELIDSNKTATKDVYVFMFFFDLIGYIIVTLGYSGFSDTDGQSVIGSVIFDNEVPSFYLTIILIMFIFSLLDRLAYLTKNVTLKLFHYVIQVILVHLWLIIISPSIFGISHKFSNNTPAKVFYFFRWAYWLLSAYQIKCSFPVRVLGNCFSKKYNKICKFSMMAFTKIPFLFELRVIMDWIFTPTTLKFSRWLQVEDAFVTTFIIKCTRCGEKLDRRTRGQLQPIFPAKFIYFAIFFAMIFVIWAPILMFSVLNKTKVSTEISVADIEIKFGAYESVFQRSNLEIIPWDLNELQMLATKYDYILIADSKNYDASQISFGNTSEQIWTITPPAKRQLVLDLESCQNMELQITLTISRKASANETSVNIQNKASGIVTTPMSQEMCGNLSKLIDDQNSSSTDTGIRASQENSVTFANVLPMFFEMNSNGDLEFVASDLSDDQDKQNWMDLKAFIEKDETYPNILQWWSVCSQQNDATTFSVYVVTTKVFPSIFSSIASYGIVGLYITFVLVASSQLKSALGGSTGKIWLQEIPDVSPIQKIILEMYMCREMKHFTLEEDLYSQLQYLYRSPETLIANTKYKKD